MSINMKENHKSFPEIGADVVNDVANLLDKQEGYQPKSAGYNRETQDTRTIEQRMMDYYELRDHAIDPRIFI